MNDNLVSMEIPLDASLFVGVEAESKKKGAESVGLRISLFLPEWVDTILANRSGLTSGRKANRRVA